MHTPLPWRIEDDNSFTTTKAIVSDALDQYGQISVIGAVWPGGFSDETKEANAAFIVRAVNSHEKLVKALEACENVIGMARLQGKLSDNGLSPVSDALILARNALTTAKEGE